MSQAELFKTEKGKAPIIFACPRLTTFVDRSEFKKTMAEKGKLYTLKKATVHTKLVSIGRYQF
jgi:hypothetical protein